jgi:hypothetical protein
LKGPAIRFCDETNFGFGWIVDEFIARTSHALLVDGDVWVIDPVSFAEAERRVRERGEPRGVIQLLSRHDRDCAAVARRLNVPHHQVPRGRLGEFEFVPIMRNRFWSEVALWWHQGRVLVCADALGTVGYFRASGEVLGVHPLLRLMPPRQFGRLEPRHVLCGHGEGIHGAGAARALEDALTTARRRLPQAWLRALRRR